MYVVPKSLMISQTVPDDSGLQSLDQRKTSILSAIQRRRLHGDKREAHSTAYVFHDCAALPLLEAARFLQRSCKGFVYTHDPSQVVDLCVMPAAGGAETLHI